ncbi:MAG: hypothetical protein WCP53_07040, partial [Verrucomicrobiota bacterium]
ELCSAAVSVSRTWQGARRSLGAGQATEPADRRSAVQRSAIRSLEPMDLENRKAGKPGLCRFRSCFPDPLSGPCFHPSKRGSAPAALSDTFYHIRPEPHGAVFDIVAVSKGFSLAAFWSVA